MLGVALDLLQGHVEILTEVEPLSALHAAEVEVGASLRPSHGLNHLLRGGVGSSSRRAHRTAGSGLLAPLDLLHQGALRVS